MTQNYNLSPDHKGGKANVGVHHYCYQGAITMRYRVITPDVEQIISYDTTEAAAQAWNEGSMVQELVGALEAVFKLATSEDILTHSALSWELDELTPKIARALIKAKGTSDDR